MLTRIALLLVFISAFVASVPGAAQSAALLAGAGKKEAMETGAQAVIVGLLLVTMDFVMNGRRTSVRPLGVGAFGTNYDARLPSSRGANPPADSRYPTPFVDGEDKPLHGANRHTLHFDAAWTPPANVLWSVTICSLQSFFVNNPIKRCAISSCMSLYRNGDGSLGFYVHYRAPSIIDGRRKPREMIPN